MHVVPMYLVVSSLVSMPGYLRLRVIGFLRSSRCSFPTRSHGGKAHSAAHVRFRHLQYLQDKTSFRRGLQCTLLDAFSCSFFCMLEKHKLQLVCAYGVRNMCETRQILCHRIDCISVAENTVVQVESLTFCHKTRKTLHC